MADLDKLLKKSASIPLISVIVPIYNEERVVGQILRKLCLLKKQISMEIIAVDDGSVDRTSEVIKEFPSVRLVTHTENMGKGKAIITGLSKSRGNIVIIQDADGEYAPEEIPKIIAPIVSGRADIVFGSRFMDITNGNGMSVSHRIANIVLSLVASLLYSVRITDIMTGHKAFSKQSIDSIDLSADGFEIEVEITGKLIQNGWRLLEVPIPYSRRQYGEAKITAKDGLVCLTKLFSGIFY